MVDLYRANTQLEKKLEPALSLSLVTEGLAHSGTSRSLKCIRKFTSNKELDEIIISNDPLITGPFRIQILRVSGA